MAEKSENQITALTKISVVANIILFGFTGIYFLIKMRTVIGIIILLAGLTNVISMLFTINRKNMIFMAINVLYAIVSLIVFMYYLLKGSNYLAVLWLAITIYYVITFSVLLYRINKEKKTGQPVL